MIGGKSKTPKVKTFLNRLFGVQLEVQKKIFRYFLDSLDQTITLAKQNNEYSEGIVDVTGEKMTLVKDTVLWADPISGAPVNLATVEQDRGVSWDLAKQRYDDAKATGRNACFMKTKNAPFGFGSNSSKRCVSLVINRAGGASSLRASMFYSQQKPNSGYAAKDIAKMHLREKNIELKDMRIAEKMWKEEYERSAHRCIHADRWTHRDGHTPATCGYGARIKKLDVVTGSLLGVWNLERYTVQETDEHYPYLD